MSIVIARQVCGRRLKVPIQAYGLGFAWPAVAAVWHGSRALSRRGWTARWGPSHVRDKDFSAVAELCEAPAIAGERHEVVRSVPAKEGSSIRLGRNGEATRSVPGTDLGWRWVRL